DFLLEGVTETHFLLGIAANMVAHVLYIIGFTVECKRLHTLRAIIPLVYISGLLSILLPNISGFMSWAVAFYAIIIGLMAWRAAAVIGQSGLNRYDEIIGLLGAWLFITCDTLIAVDKFVVQILYAKYWIMTSYWIGQWCIAYSIIILFPGQKRARL
ncbi:MAG TPA: lysoplasmalogenase, partial [Spirochaetota bacterium]|nr:lysoplasmalogenase [Spirochaetota bacterium]